VKSYMRLRAFTLFVLPPPPPPPSPCPRFERDINPGNVLGTGGALARTYADLLQRMWAKEGDSYVRPDHLKAVIGKFAPQFLGYDQHDSQVRASA
jgi:hypothetical protein